MTKITMRSFINWINKNRCINLMIIITILEIYIEKEEIMYRDCRKYIKKQKEYIYLNAYNTLPQNYYEHVILIFSLRSPFVKHIRSENLIINEKNKAVYVSLLNKKCEADIVDLENITQYLNSKRPDSLYAIIDPELIRIARILEKNNLKFYVFSTLLNNIYTNTKIRILNNIFYEVIKIKNKGYSLDRFKNLGINVEKYKYIEILSFVLIKEDTLSFEISFPIFKKNSAENELCLAFFKEIKNLVGYSFFNLPHSKSKIEWCDKITNHILDFLYKKEILKSKLNLNNDVEIISLLFPQSFVNLRYPEFSDFDLVKVVISFKDLKFFKFYSEYFNTKKIDIFVRNMPKIAFSYFKTKLKTEEI